MNTKLLLLLTLSVFLLIGCSAQTYVCPDGSTVTDAKACLDNTDIGDAITVIKDDASTDENQKITPEPNGVTFTLDEKELQTLVSVDDYSYTAAPKADNFGDKSSVRNIAGTKKYEAFLKANLNYVQTGKYEDAVLFVKIIGAGLSGDLTSVVYEGYLAPGKETIDFSTMLQTHAENPRLNFCFGFEPDFDPFFEEDEHIACFTKLLEGPEHRLYVSQSDIVLSFDAFHAQSGDTLRMEKEFLMKNDGTVPTTFFLYVSNPEEQYTLVVDKEAVFLAPGDEETITVTGTWNYDESNIFGRETIAIYTASDSCAPSLACANTARVSKEIEVRLQN